MLCCASDRLKVLKRTLKLIELASLARLSTLLEARRIFNVAAGATIVSDYSPYTRSFGCLCCEAVKALNIV